MQVPRNSWELSPADIVATGPYAYLLHQDNLGSILPPGSLELADDRRLSPLQKAVTAAVVTGIIAGTAGKFGSSVVKAAPPATVPVSADAPPIMFLSYDDSIGVGRAQKGEEGRLESAGITDTRIDARGGRQTIYGPCVTDPNGPDCLALPDVMWALDRDRELLPSATAIAIRTNTNDAKADTYNELLAAGRKAAMMGAVDGTVPLIILSKPFGDVPRVGAEVKGPVVDQVAEVLVAEGVPTVVLDYAALVKEVIAPAGGVAADGVHLTPDGYQMMVDYDAAILPELIKAHHAKLYPPAAPETPPVIIEPTPTPPPLAEPVKVPDPKEEFILDLPAPSVPNPQTSGRRSNQSKTVVMDLMVPEVLRATTAPIPAVVVDLSPAPETLVAPAMQDIASDTVPLFALLEDNQALPIPVYEPPKSDVTPTTTNPELTGNQEIIDKAAQYGIFYDENGQARQYLGDFINRQEQPILEVSEPFGDHRVRKNGPYRQGDTDFRSGSEPRQVLAPAVGVVETYYTPGEGNKVVVRMGIDPETGLPFRFWDKHLSEILVEPGQLVLPGDLLGFTGETGDSSGIHHSVGITSHETDMTEYINFQEAQGQHVLDYMPNIPVVCPPAEDDIEICGPTIPGVYKSLTVDVADLESLGLPEYLPDTVSNNPETEHAEAAPIMAFDPSLVDPETAPNIDDIAIDPALLLIDDSDNRQSPVVFDTPRRNHDEESTSNLPDQVSVPEGVPTIDDIVDDTTNPEEIVETPPVPADLNPPEQPTDPGEAPQPEPAPEEPPVSPETPAIPEGLHPNEIAIPLALRSLYWIDENGAVHDEALVQYIKDTFAMATPSEMYPEGYYRMPDNIPGLPYEFSSIASQTERYMRPELAATLIVMSLKYQEFQQAYPVQQGRNLRFIDAVSTHKEHRHGLDIDIGLIEDPEARTAFALELASWLNAGGVPRFHHIVTGEKTLEQAGDGFVDSRQQDDPEFIYQADHGSNPAAASHHWHVSMDAGYGGPFMSPEAHVPLSTGDVGEPPQSQPMNWEALQVLGQQVANQVLGPVNPPEPEPEPEPAPEPSVPEVPPAQARREMLEQDPLAFVPEQWRGIIYEAAGLPENAEGDARVVAAVLWVENRHWPEDPYKEYNVSSAKARGPWQILPQTWFGWNTDVDNWGDGSNYTNDSLYSSSGVGRDVDGDGVKNPENPRDAAAGAFQVMPGAGGDPIAHEGISGDPTQDIYSAKFDKDSETLLARCANYNGDGSTPNHVTLAELANHRAQNPDYIRMCAALLMTGMQYGIILDREGPGFTWVNAQTLQPVSPEEVRAAVVG